MQGGSNYSCAALAIDITPRQALALAGYAGGERTSEGVESALEANLVCLSDGEARVLFVALDLLYAGAALTRMVRTRAAAHGLAPAQVVVAASHTHFAPATDHDKAALGRVDEAYFDELAQRLGEAVDRVLALPLQPVRVERAAVETAANIHRRKRWRWPTLTRRGLRLGPVTVMAPEPAGPRDPLIEALRLRGADGALLAVLWKFGCHPVSFPQSRRVSAEYPGVARARLRAEHGAALPVVFWQGLAGDVRPRIEGRLGWRERAATVLTGPIPAPVDLAAWRAWAQGVASDLARAVAMPAGDVLQGPLRTAGASVAMSELVEGGEPGLRERDLAVQLVRFGDGLEAVFLAAEPCSPWAGLLRGQRPAWIVGYTGDVQAYLPSAAQVAEGGYESGEFFACFGAAARFLPGFEGRVREAVAAARRTADLAGAAG